MGEMFPFFQSPSSALFSFPPVLLFWICLAVSFAATAIIQIGSVLPNDHNCKIFCAKKKKKKVSLQHLQAVNFILNFHIHWHINWFTFPKISKPQLGYRLLSLSIHSCFHLLQHFFSSLYCIAWQKTTKLAMSLTGTPTLILSAVAGHRH